MAYLKSYTTWLHNNSDLVAQLGMTTNLNDIGPTYAANKTAISRALVKDQSVFARIPADQRTAAQNTVATLKTQNPRTLRDMSKRIHNEIWRKEVYITRSS